MINIEKFLYIQKNLRPLQHMSITRGDKDVYACETYGLLSLFKIIEKSAQRSYY